jgi:uncharacterized membrane protein YphA (DoxX/SURF4 family)
MKIAYWIATGLFGALMLMSAYMYLSGAEQVTDGLAKLGYPVFLLQILGVAKLLGAIALLTPKFPKLKEWAYAGFAFNLIGAIWTHVAVGDGNAVNVLIPFALYLASYTTYTLLQKNMETAIAK